MQAAGVLWPGLQVAKRGKPCMREIKSATDRPETRETGKPSQSRSSLYSKKRSSRSASAYPGRPRRAAAIAESEEASR